jgi:hypothetical protein
MMMFVGGGDTQRNVSSDTQAISNENNDNIYGNDTNIDGDE